MFTMRKYDKEFKEEAVKLSDEVGVKQAASQLGIPYYSLAEWRQKRKTFGDHAFVGSGIRRDAPLSENERRLMRENAELRKANEILKDALGFFAKDRKMCIRDSLPSGQDPDCQLEDDQQHIA